MRPMLLNLDGALERQPLLCAATRAAGGRMLCARDLGPHLRLWSRRAHLAELRRRLSGALPKDAEPEVVFAGSGDFHHVTPLLLERALAEVSEPVTLIHFDNHPDWARFAAGSHCGSWLAAAARQSGVRQVVTIGVTSTDVGPRKSREGDLSLIAEGRLAVFPWAAPGGREALSLGGQTWPAITALGEDRFLDLLDATVSTRAIYATIDKDVLQPAQAVTNWDQGAASLEFVEAALHRLLAGRTLVAADVVGDWSAPDYGRGPPAWLKRGEALLDQPRRRPDTAHADAVNEAANLRLLHAFQEAAA